MYVDDLAVKANETESQYLWRIGRQIDNGVLEMSWDDFAILINKAFRKPEKYISSKTYYNNYVILRKVYEDNVFLNCSSADELSAIREERHELEKERVKIKDERREYRKLIAAKARQENFFDYVEELFHTHQYQPVEVDQDFNYPKVTSGDCDLLIPLTDLHIGIKIDNFWNTYNDEVVKERFSKYVREIATIQQRHGAENAHIVLSEIVSGTIHNTLRIEANEDVITQFLKAMNHIIWFLIQLSGMFKEAHVYVAPGNHSRVFPKKEENMKGENFDHLAIPYLKGYLQHIDNIEFHLNEITEDIALFSIRGNTVTAVHGDKDTTENVSRHITELFGITPKIVLLGHRHTNAMVSANGGCKVIQSGSMSGIDNYCLDSRLKGRPEQAVSVINSNGLECIYDLDLR